MAKEALAFLGLLAFFLVLDEAFSAKSYVVYMGAHHEEHLELEKVYESHCELLQSVLGSKEAATNSIFYSYSRIVNGFAAVLDEEQVQAISKLDGVISVFENRPRKLHTTHSWKFLGLESGQPDKLVVPEDSLWKKANFGKDIIIANLDTGAWPESASFHDEGLGPIPSRWKGFCESGTNFTKANCNRKLIGARSFFKGAIQADPQFINTTKFLSPRDSIGHGSHTLSTAGGNFVANASLYGVAEGIAKGGAPHARVVAYKVCWEEGCFDADILAAFDAGIYEGVDVFSLSLGSDPPLNDYFEDATSIGAFHAVERGKVVICSAGNYGPTPATVSNVAPWIITVGASTVDREFVTYAFLGNKKTYKGASETRSSLEDHKMYPLVSSVEVKAPHASETDGQLCFPGSLDPNKVKGKIVACLLGENPTIEKGVTVRDAGGVGMILCNSPSDGDDVAADPHYLPAVQLNAVDGAKVFEYINSTVSPVASISPANTIIGKKKAPVMADFSSRGPNSLTPDILKPDITAPGVDILAAWSGVSPPSEYPGDDRVIPFNIIEGTSMSCPHVSGVVALLKAAHPDWSPAAIRSAIVTSAATLDNTKDVIKNSTGKEASAFDYGGGHLNANGAADPGLVYDISNKDYYTFLCSLNYNSSQIRAITGKEITCPSQKDPVYNLNYPSITVSELKASIFVRRTVTYVADGPAIFQAKVRSPSGTVVAVKPNKLEFAKKGEQKSFYVAIKPKKGADKDYVFGFVEWTYKKYVVRSQIVVKAIAA